MNIVFVSNYMSHHQLFLSNELYEITGGHYSFIATEPISDERLKMGWQRITAPYIIEVDNSNKETKVDTEELNFDDDFSNLESENKSLDNNNSNEKNEVNNSTDDFDDLFKEESVPEKIEVDGKTYVKVVNGYVLEGLENEKDVLKI